MKFSCVRLLNISIKYAFQIRQLNLRDILLLNIHELFKIFAEESVISSLIFDDLFFPAPCADH